MDGSTKNLLTLSPWLVCSPHLLGSAGLAHSSMLGTASGMNPTPSLGQSVVTSLVMTDVLMCT